jgi:LacI family transcriptional regulator
MTADPALSLEGDRRRRVTAADVAALAGTSVATVSLVANGKTKGRISAENITRVEAAIAELGYVVDHAASALARGSADVVILVAPDLSNPYYGDVVTGITSVLGERYQLLLSVTTAGVQPTARALRRFVSLRPAGLLIDAPSETFLTELPAGPATVLIDAPGFENRAATVNYDLGPGVDDLVAHLADQGHRTIAYVDSVTGSETFTLRRALVEVAAQRSGLRVVDGVRSLVESGDAAVAADGAWSTWRALGATAVICATDTQAYGVLFSARRNEVGVPEDFAVTGFDDLPPSSLTAPALTSVALPGLSIGRAAAHRLLEQLEPSSHVTPPADLVARLVIRGSSLRP